MANEKEEFRQKVAKATDTQLEKGYGSLKKQVRVARETLVKERQDVENMLQNPAYLTALDQVEQAKLDLSIKTWKLQEVEREQARRFRENTPENDTKFESE
jgi:hypothetical protein